MDCSASLMAESFVASWENIEFDLDTAKKMQHLLSAAASAAAVAANSN